MGKPTYCTPVTPATPDTGNGWPGCRGGWAHEVPRWGGAPLGRPANPLGRPVNPLGRLANRLGCLANPPGRPANLLRAPGQSAGESGQDSCRGLTGSQAKRSNVSTFSLLDGPCLDRCAEFP